MRYLEAFLFSFLVASNPLISTNKFIDTIKTLQKLLVWRFFGLKVAFFQKMRSVFQVSKKYSKSLSWPWNLKKLLTFIGGKFKFQDSYLEYVFGDLTNTSHFLKKNPLEIAHLNYSDKYGLISEGIFNLVPSSKTWTKSLFLNFSKSMASSGQVANIHQYFKWT